MATTASIEREFGGDVKEGMNSDRRIRCGGLVLLSGDSSLSLDA